MSSCIIDATSKLLRLIKVDEAQALAGKIRFDSSALKPERGNRFGISPNFHFPGLAPDRPISTDSRVAFHLRHTVVVKEAGYGRGSDRTQRYSVVVTPEGRTISTSAAGFDRYICREDAVLKVEPTIYEGSDDSEIVVRTPAIFTNISPNLDRRVEFWDAVTRCERTPTPDVVTLYPERLSQEQWAKIVDNYEGPSVLMDALLSVQADLSVRLLPQAGGRNGAVNLKMRNSEFAEFRRYLKRIEAWDRVHPPASIKRGRAGRIQRRLVAELPAGLTDVAMFLVAQKFADYLAKKQVMYTVVVHAPDAHNDKRNFHLHAIAYDRPSKFLAELECWDFEYREPVPGQYKRERFPHRQNKNPSLTRSSSDKNFRQYATEVIVEFRKVYAAICNEQLLDCGSHRFFDHRSYEQMGIKQAPGKRMSQRDSLLESAGIPTIVGMENAEKSWQGAFDREIEAHRLRQEKRERCRERARLALRKKHHTEPGSRAPELDQQLRHFDELIDELGERELALAKLELTLRMAYSRADKTFEVCQRLVDSIESGTAKAADVRWEDEIRDRQRAAEDHFELIDAINFGPIEAVRNANLDLPVQTQAIAEVMSKMQALAEEVEKEAIAMASGQGKRNVSTTSLDRMPNSVGKIRDLQSTDITPQIGLPTSIELEPASSLPPVMEAGFSLRSLVGNALDSVDAALGAAKSLLGGLAKRIPEPSAATLDGSDLSVDRQVETVSAARPAAGPSRGSPASGVGFVDVTRADAAAANTECELDWLAHHLAHHLDTEEAIKKMPVRRVENGWQLDVSGLSPYFQDISTHVANRQMIVRKVNDMASGYERAIERLLQDSEPLLVRDAKGVQIVPGKMPRTLEIHLADLLRYDEEFRRLGMMAIQRWKAGAQAQSSTTSSITTSLNSDTARQKHRAAEQGITATEVEVSSYQKAWLAGRSRGR